LELRSRRPTASGEGTRYIATPKSREHQEDGDPAASILGPPPPEGKIPAPKRHSGRAARSRTPPAGPQTETTLCTRRKSGPPHPPAAGAAVGG
jgi:hypothetical protein